MYRAHPNICVELTQGYEELKSHVKNLHFCMAKSFLYSNFQISHVFGMIKNGNVSHTGLLLQKKISWHQALSKIKYIIFFSFHFCYFPPHTQLKNCIFIFYLQKEIHAFPPKDSTCSQTQQNWLSLVPRTMSKHLELTPSYPRNAFRGAAGHTQTQPCIIPASPPPPGCSQSSRQAQRLLHPTEQLWEQHAAALPWCWEPLKQNKKLLL